MRRALAFIIIHLVLRVLCWIPLSGLHQMGQSIGWLMSRRNSAKNFIIQRNMTLAYPELDASTRTRWWRESVNEMACFALETGLIWHGHRAQIERAIVRVDGLSHVEQARNSGRGLLLIAAHLGNWELLNLYCMHHFNTVALYKAPRDPMINQWIKATRERFGGRLIPSGSASMRALLQALRTGGVAGIVADQQPRLGDGVMAPFFGQSALTMTLAGRLANKTGCEVLMASCYREKGHGFRIEFVPMSAEIRHNDPVIAATALNSAIQSAVDKAPQQYLWRYPRFPEDAYKG